MIREDLSTFTFSEEKHKNVFYDKNEVDFLLNSLEQQNTALQAHIKELEESKTCDMVKIGTSNIVQISQILYRDIPLDEAVFVTLTGLNNINTGRKLTGLDRLKGAIILLQREVDKIEKEYQEFGG